MRANTTSLWLVASQASLRALVALTLAAAACGDPIEDAKRQALDAAIARATAVGVAPRVDCVIDHSGGRYTAYFGWRNDGASVSQAIGPLNGFAPGAQDRGQPTTFPRGQSRAAPNSPVIFDFDGAPVTWTLLTATATATSGSPRCADTAAPVWPHGSTLTATGLADGSVKLDWTAATDAAYVAKYRVFANGRQLLELDGAATTVTTSLLEAAHDYTLAVQAGDPNGNWSTSGPTAVFDLNPPVVTVTGVSDGLVTRSSVTPVITATDDLLVSARTLLDGQAFTSGATVVAEGTHKLDVLAKDQGGHSTRVLLTFIIDRTPPLLRISGATDGSRIRTFPRISIVSTDANAGTTTVRLDGVTLPDAQPFTVSTEGAHQVQATAVDRAGNASQAQLSFFIDRTPPGVSILAPADRAVVAPGELEVIAAVSDDGPLGAVTLNQQLMTLEGDGSWHGTVALTRGSNLLQVRASDIAGNSSTARVRVTVDTQPPVLTVTSPAEGARIAALTVPLKGKATDASPLTVTVSGAPVTLAADGTFSSTVALVAGTNAITILASDSAGNATTVVRHVRANVTPPTIAFTSPAADGYTNQTSLTVTGVAQPADPSDLVTVKVNGTAVPVDVHGVFSRTVTIGAGTTTIMAVATDGFGLTSTAVLRLGQDRAAPIIELTGAKDGLLTSAASVTPVFTATDAHLASVTAQLDGVAFASGTPVSAEGDHVLSIVALDLAGNRTNLTAHFALDRVPPQIDLQGPQPGETRNTPATLTFTANDAHPGTTSGTLDGHPFTSGGAVSEEGQHTLLVTSTDLAGNFASATLSFTIDTQPPALQVLAPLDGSVVSTPVLEVVAQVSDASDIVQLTANGVTMTPGADGKFQAAVSLAEGVNQVSVFALDLAGNVTTVQLSVALDTQAPLLTVASPAEGARVPALSVAVMGSVQDASAVTLTVAGQHAGVGADGAFSIQTQLVAGANALTVTAVDAAGNATTLVRNVRANVTPPALTITAPIEGTLVSSATVQLEGTATPADPADALTLTLAGSVIPLGADGHFSAAVPLSEGDNTLLVHAVDGYGLAADAQVHVVRDSTPPQLAITGVADGQITNAPALLPAFTVSDAHPGSASSTLDGAPFASGDAVTSEGEHDFVVTAVDAAHNTAQAHAHFALDRTAPAIHILGVADGARVSQPVTLVYSADDAHPASVEGTLDGVPFASSGLVSSEGTHVLLVRALDAAGNAAQQQVTFVLDQTPPLVSFVSPQPNAIVPATPLPVIVTVAEAGPLASVTVGNTSLSLAQDGTWQGEVALSDGLNTLLAVAIDTAGNSGQATLQVTLDRTPPVLTVAAPQEGARLAALSVTVQGTVHDANPVTLTVAGVPVPVAGDGSFSTSAALVAGANAIAVVATDAANNATTQTVHVRANLTPPALAITAPADGSSTEADSVQITGTASAADSSDQVALTLEGAQVTVGSDGTFTANSALAVGDNALHFLATDGYGLTTAVTLHLTRTPPAPDAGPDAGTPDAGPDAGLDAGPDAGTPDGGGTVDAGGTPDAGADAGTPPAPSILLDAPASGATLSAQVITVSGHVSGGAQPLSVTVDGSSVSLNGGAFTTSAMPAEGDHTFTAQVTDALGRTASAQTLVHVDRTPPVLTVTRPSATPAFVSETPYTLQGTVTDANLASLVINGAQVSVIGGSFQLAIPLSPGDSDVTLVATDLAGNQSTFVQHFVVNAVPPQVTIVSPADGSEATAAVIPVTVHVTASGAVSVVTIAGIQATAAGGGDWTAQVPLALGDNTLSISATDVFGLTGTAQLAVHYRDPATEPLTVQAVEPAPGATDVQPDSMVSITFNKAFDPASLPAGFTVLQDGKAVEGGYAISPSSQTASFVPRGPLTESAHLQVRVSGVAPGVGLGMSGDFVSDFTVRRPLTQVSGIVLDQQHKPLADVAVTLESQNLTARTGPDGNWTIFAARGGSGVLRFDGPKLADGRPLPTVRHTLFINAEGVTQDRTLVLVPIEGASAQRIDTLLPVSASFNGTQPGLLLETSAGSLTLPDGQTSGYVTATRVPAYAAPASRTGRTPVAVWQLGPPQTSFTKPVTLTMPNLHGLSAGQHAVVYGYDPILNRVLPLGLAKVSDDASVMVSDALSAPSFEFFGYAGLTDAEQALYANGVPTSPSAPSNLRRVPGPSLTPQQQLKGKGALLRPSDAPLPLLQGPASLGLFGIKDALAQPDDNCVGGSCQLGGLGFLFNIPDLEPRWTHVSGRVRSPGEDQTEVEPSAPTPAGKTRITLPYSLAASFSVTRRPDPYGGSNIVNAQLTAFANGTQPIAAPPGETWTGTGDGAASASGNVPLQFGTNKIVMTGQSALGVTSITYLAQVDPASGDAGTDQADLTVTKVEDKTADEPLKDLIIYPNQPVEIGGEESMAVTGLTGTYFYVGVWWGLDVDYQNFAQFPLSSHGVRMPDGRVRRVPGVYFGQTPPYTWNSWGTDGVDMMVDARTISGTLTFVDKDGTPLPPACDDGSPTQRNDDGTLSALSARSVGTTEVHFFLEDDLEHPIADYTLGAPVADQGGCSAQGHAHGFYTQLRIGPSDFRKKVRCNELRQANLTSLDYYKAWCIDDQRKHALELKTHDRLVVFAVNHDTGYSGITTVEVPPILTSSPGCENLPDVVFNFQGRVQHLPACTNANITIPANLKLYPPEIDVRVARRAPDEGVKAPTDEGSSPPPTDHLVRQGGSATTRDEFFKIATHWRVRKAANPPPAQSDGAPDPECTKYTESDGGVVYKASADGGACKPARIQDSDTDAGSPLEVYCSEVPDGGDLSTCIHDDTVLVDVPQGVPPIAGRIWSQTGTAAGEPMPIVFDLGPGQHTSLVSPSVSFRNADGALTSAGNLSRANYFVQVVGKPLTPQEPPPPDFTDDPQAQGRPKGAIGLKNVYRALDGSGRMQERFDRAREHQFSVLQIGDHSVVAQTSAGTRDLTADGANASASDEDVSYQFLMQVLEPEGDVSRTPPPGQYELRLGGDVVGETCQLQIQGTGASKSLSGTCAGESLMDVLSASDILYIELYLSGNAENILYRFNFNGLTLREDQLSVGMATTDGKLAKSEVDGTPTPRRPVMSPALAEFFVQPSEVKHGVVKICLDRDCASSNSALKVMQFDWNDATSDYKVITTGGRADLTAVPPTKREGFGIDNAAFYTLPLPNDLLSGSQTLKDGLYVHYEPTEPRLKPFSRSLGRPQHQLESQAVSPPGHPLAAGIDITDGHLSRIWVDLQVPEGGGKLAFARAYNNQNNEIHTMGLGWWHNFEGQVLEERGGRYTVLLGGQGYEFSKCETTRDENLLVTDVSGCQSNKDHGGKLDVTVQGGVSYTFVFTRGTDGVKFTFDRPMQFDAVQKRGEGGRRWLMTSIDDGLGTTDVKYLTKSDLVDTAGRRGGHHQLKFLYSEVDDGPDGCGAFGNKIARKLTRAQRNSNFKLLKEVQLKRGEDTIDRAVYEHEMDAQTCAVTAALRVGNLTGVRKDSEQPAWHTTYKYKDVPASADEKSWPLRNELEEAKFLLGAQEALHSHWVIHHASGVSPYPHVDVNEVVDDVVETGQASIPVHTTYNGDTARVVSMPGRTPITYTLNSFGNPVNTQGAEGTATATWDSNSDDGPVVLTAEQAADGQGITTTYDPVTLQPLTVTLASGHAGAVQSSTISAGTVLIGGSEPDPRWNQPTRFSLSGTPGSAVRTFDATGQISSLTVGGIQVSTASHDSEGALEAATLPSGAVVQYSGKNGNGQPTAVNVSHGTSADFALEYDEFGRLIHKSNSADGSDETWAYDSLGRVTKHTASGSPPRVEENAYTDTDEGYSVVRSLNGTALETESWQDNRIRSRSTGGGLMTVTYDYDEAGRLDTETQVIGGGKTIVRKHTYDDAGREIAVTLNGKALVTRVLDAAGNATLVTDQDGLTTQIGYDALGRAVTWTQGASTRQVDLDSSTGQIMLELSGSHIVRTERDAVGRPKNITSVGQPGGLHVQYTGTDAAGHVDSMQTDGLSETYEYADYRGRMTKRTRSTAGGTLTETWTYAPASGGESITYQQSGGAADHTTVTTYDSLGRLLSRQETVDSQASVTSYTYDSLGHIATETQPNGGTIVYEADALGHVTKRTDSAGIVTSFTVDALGRVLTQTGPRSGESWTFEYDDFNRQTKRTLSGPHGGSWTTDYGMNGVVTMTDPEGITTTQTFDAAHRKVYETEGGSLRTIAYYYDGDYERQRVISEGGSVRTFTTVFNDRNLPVNMEETWTGPAGSYDYSMTAAWSGTSGQITQSWGGGSRSFHTTIDGLGNTLSRDDGPEMGTWTYDAAGLLTSSQLPGQAARTITYEESGRPVLEQQGAEQTLHAYYPDGTEKLRIDPSGRSATMEYDLDDRPTSVSYAGVTRTMGYEDGGNKPTRVDDAGKLSTMTYGPRGELMSLTLPIGTVTYDYDRNLRLTGVHAPNLEQSFGYDPLGRPTSRSRGSAKSMSWTTTWAAGEATTTDADGNQVIVSLDGRERTIKRSYRAGANSIPGLQDVTFTYDDLDQLVGATRHGEDGDYSTSYMTDSRGRVTSITSDDGTSVAYDYGAHGLPTKTTTPGGSVVYAYDEFGRVSLAGGSLVAWEPGGERLSLVESVASSEARCYTTAGYLQTIVSGPGVSGCGSSSQVYSRFDYTYDVRGNRMTELYTDGRGGTAYSTFDYDASDRLIGQHRDDGSDDVYTLRFSGVRDSETQHRLLPPPEGETEPVDVVHTINYALDDAEKLNGIVVDGVQATVQTDLAGRTHRFAINGLDRKLDWDAAGRLVRSTTTDADANFTIASHRYDHLNRRIETLTIDDITTFTWGLNTLLEEKSGLSSRTYARVGDVALSVGGEQLMHDAVESAVGRASETGLVASSRFDAWGTYLSGAPTGTDPTPGFAGQSWDPKSQLSYAEQRWYAPELGRFLSEDAIGATPGRIASGMGLGGFAYAGGNPTNVRDPKGLFEEPTHGALTYWMSYYAGFTEPEAATIALGAAGVDHNPATLPADMSRLGITIRNGLNGQTTHWHFADPREALDRVWEVIYERNTPYYRFDVLIDEKFDGFGQNTRRPSSQVDLYALGRSLHTLEDVGFEDEQGPHMRGLNPQWGNFDLINSAIEATSPNGRTGHPIYVNEDGTVSQPRNHTADQLWTNPKANTHLLSRIFSDVIVPAAKVVHPGSHGEQNKPDVEALLARFVSQNTKEGVEKLLKEAPPGAMNSYWNIIEENCAADGTGDKDFQARRERLGRPQLGCEYAWQTKDIDNSAPEKYGGSWWGKQWDRFTATPVPLGDPTRALPVMIKAYWDRAHRKSP